MKSVRRVTKRSTLLGLIVSVLVFYCVSVMAIPVPKGIDGRIMEPDETEVSTRAHFSVNNTANDYFVEGMTGHGSVGRYSVSMKGDDGDIIVIKAWRNGSFANRTVALQGVMRNVNLVFNGTPSGQIQSRSGAFSITTVDSAPISSVDSEGGNGERGVTISAITVNEEVLDYKTIEDEAFVVIGNNEGKQKLQGGGGGKEDRSVSDYDVSSLPQVFKIFGTLYGSEGLEVVAGTPFEIENEDTNELISGVTGIGPFNGRFVAVVHGKDGDQLSISAGTEKREVVSFFAGEGVHEITAVYSEEGRRFIPFDGFDGLNGLTGFSVYGVLATTPDYFQYLVGFLMLYGIISSIIVGKILTSQKNRKWK